ncbi:UNVERIFIED_CONTAM: hypothetical protein FKN15_030257 [Acipenser sinensis]
MHLTLQQLTELSDMETAHRISDSATAAAGHNRALGYDKQASLGSAVQASLGSAVQASLGSVVQASLGSAVQASLGSGEHDSPDDEPRLDTKENPEPSEKHNRINSFAVDFHRSQESDKVLSCEVVEESRSLFHCYINEVEHLGRAKLNSKASGPKHSNLHVRETLGDDELDEEMNSLAKFNIPNFVSSEQSSTLGDDDLLLCEQPIILNNNGDDSSTLNPQLRSQTQHGLF